MFSFKKPVLEFYPYIDEGDLVIDSRIDGEPCNTIRTKLEVLFDDYLDYRREMYSADIRPEYRLEVREMVGVLRNIAREMEIEIDAITH